MANISLKLYTNGFFGSVLKSPTQMGSLNMNNSFTNISCLGTFKNELTLNKSVVFSVPNISCWVQGCAHSSGRFHNTSLLRHTVQLQQPQHIHHLISEDYRVRLSKVRYSNLNTYITSYLRTTG